jgi:hypothetical protein
MKYRYYIGIDPDVTASGVCVWDAKEKRIAGLQCMPMFGENKYQSEELGLIDYLDEIHKWDEGEFVIVSAGWLNKSNYHARANESHKANAIIGERTGANHEVGKKIVEMCTYLGLSCELSRPTQSKIKADYFKQMTGWKGRTNQEMRDAAMLVFGI